MGGGGSEVPQIKCKWAELSISYMRLTGNFSENLNESMATNLNPPPPPHDILHHDTYAIIFYNPVAESVELTLSLKDIHNLFFDEILQNGLAKVTIHAMLFLTSK